MSSISFQPSVYAICTVLRYEYAMECMQLTRFDCDTFGEPKCEPYITYDDASCPVIKCEASGSSSSTTTTTTETTTLVTKANVSTPNFVSCVFFF